MKKALVIVFLLQAFYAYTQNTKGNSYVLASQYPYNEAHSHNDYLQKRPFFTAYEAQMGSIEADVFLIDGKLFVAHEESEVIPGKTLTEVYLKPLAERFKQNGNKPYPDADLKLQLVIDIKKEYQQVIPVLLQELAPYLQVFDASKNKYAVRVVLSGNMPAPALFEKYPSYIFYDGRPYFNYTKAQLRQVAMVSDALGNYTKWNGKGDLSVDDRKKLLELVQKVHLWQKPFRFWGAADNEHTWKTLKGLGVDWINTDHPELVRAFYAK